MGAAAEQEYRDIKAKNNFIEPDRGNLDDPSIKWRTGKPNYFEANYAYFKGKTMNHPQGSLEKVVEDLVKTWEMEATHKLDSKQWTAIDQEKYCVSANGWKVWTGAEAKEVGNYVWLLSESDKELFDAKNHNFESSHNLFRNCFTNGFPWEVISVFSGPPKVVFSWRHWGIFDGEYKNRKGDGEVYELYGILEAIVNESLKIQSIEVYYKPEPFLEALEGLRSYEELRAGKNVVGSGCPFAKLN